MLLSQLLFTHTKLQELGVRKTTERHVTKRGSALVAIMILFWNTLAVALSADERRYASGCNLHISCNK